MKTSIIKQAGQRSSEQFQEQKLRHSIVAACLSVRSPEGEAEKVADDVCWQVINWLDKKPEVTSEDIRRKAGETLAMLHPEAAYLYKHHQLVL